MTDAHYEQLPAGELSEFKKEQMMKAFSFSWSKEEAHGYHVQLYKSLANDYYWSGNCFFDWIFFVLQWHPLLGVFFCHPAHPYSKRERIAVLIFECAATLLPSALLVLCSEAAEKGGIVDKDHEEKLSHGLILVCVTLPVAIVELLLYQLAIVDVYIKDRDLIPSWRIDDYCLTGLAIIARGIFCCFVSMTIFYAVFVAMLSDIIMLSTGHPVGALLHPFVVSRLQSWILWFFIWTFLPYLGFISAWSKERREMLDADAA